MQYLRTQQSNQVSVCLMESLKGECMPQFAQFIFCPSGSRGKGGLKVRILIVEDNREMAVILHDALEKQMHRAVCASTGTEGLDIAMEQTFEAILLDAMLPGMDGFSVVRALREAGVAIPILMLTARDAKADVVMGLDCGVDDYLTKPFVFQELFARLRAISRRQPTLTALRLCVDDLQLDLKAHTASRADKPIVLTRTEFFILEFMMRHPSSLLRRTEIINAVWGYEDTVEHNTLDVFVKQLRAKIDGSSERKLIQTVRGFGYKLAAATR
jgi:DNA-binding response OmpR family regulator